MYVNFCHMDRIRELKAEDGSHTKGRCSNEENEKDSRISIIGGNGGVMLDSMRQQVRGIKSTVS